MPIGSLRFAPSSSVENQVGSRCACSRRVRRQVTLRMMRMRLLRVSVDSESEAPKQPQAAALGTGTGFFLESILAFT